MSAKLMVFRVECDHFHGPNTWKIEYVRARSAQDAIQWARMPDQGFKDPIRIQYLHDETDADAGVPIAPYPKTMAELAAEHSEAQFQAGRKAGLREGIEQALRIVRRRAPRHPVFLREVQDLLDGVDK